MSNGSLIIFVPMCPTLNSRSPAPNKGQALWLENVHPSWKGVLGWKIEVECQTSAPLRPFALLALRRTICSGGNGSSGQAFGSTLPPNLFYGTSIPACIVVIDKQD